MLMRSRIMQGSCKRMRGVDGERAGPRSGGSRRRRVILVNSRWSRQQGEGVEGQAVEEPEGGNWAAGGIEERTAGSRVRGSGQRAVIPMKQ